MQLKHILFLFAFLPLFALGQIPSGLDSAKHTPNLPGTISTPYYSGANASNMYIGGLVGGKWFGYFTQNNAYKAFNDTLKHGLNYFQIRGNNGLLNSQSYYLYSDNTIHWQQSEFDGKAKFLNGIQLHNSTSFLSTPDVGYGLLAFLNNSLKAYRPNGALLTVPDSSDVANANVLKVNISDTAAMLSRYANKYKTNTFRLNQQFNASVGVRGTQPSSVEDVGLWSNVSGTGGSTGVSRAFQGYNQYSGNNAFTVYDGQATVNTTSPADHSVVYQSNTILNNTSTFTSAYNFFSTGNASTATGTITNAFGYYHGGWYDPSNKITNKWSFYAAADYMFLSIGSGLAGNTFTPQEFIDIDFGNTNGKGAKLANAYVGNYNTAGAIASFGHYANKSTPGALALLQLSDGTTFLNAKHGKSIYLTSNLVNAMRIDTNSNVQIGHTVNDALADSGDPLQVYGTSLFTSDIKFNVPGSNINFNNTGSTRWNTTYDEAESTGDAGSNWKLYNYHDNGTIIGTALTINRATGAAIFSGNLSALLTLYSSGTNLPVVYNSTNNRFETTTNIPPTNSEGTWTPTGSTTLGSASGTYTKTGNLVHARFTITINTNTSGSTFQISGLPFANSASSYGVVTFALNSTGSAFTGEVNISASSFNLYTLSGVLVTNLQMSNSQINGEAVYNTTN